MLEEIKPRKLFYLKMHAHTHVWKLENEPNISKWINANHCFNLINIEFNLLMKKIVNKTAIANPVFYRYSSMRVNLKFKINYISYNYITYICKFWINFRVESRGQKSYKIGVMSNIRLQRDLYNNDMIYGVRISESCKNSWSINRFSIP